MFNLGRVTDSEKLAEKLKAGSGHDHFIAIAGFRHLLEPKTQQNQGLSLAFGLLSAGVDGGAATDAAPRPGKEARGRKDRTACLRPMHSRKIKGSYTHLPHMLAYTNMYVYRGNYT